MYVVKRQKSCVNTGTVSPQRKHRGLRQWKERNLRVKASLLQLFVKRDQHQSGLRLGATVRETDRNDEITKRTFKDNWFYKIQYQNMSQIKSLVCFYNAAGFLALTYTFLFVLKCIKR